MTNLGPNQIESISDDKFDVAKMRISLFDRVENIVGKGENGGTFSPFPTMFSKDLFVKVIKSQYCMVKSSGELVGSCSLRPPNTKYLNITSHSLSIIHIN